MLNSIAVFVDRLSSHSERSFFLRSHSFAPYSCQPFVGSRANCKNYNPKCCSRRLEEEESKIRVRELPGEGQDKSDECDALEEEERTNLKLGRFLLDDGVEIEHGSLKCVEVELPHFGSMTWDEYAALFGDESWEEDKKLKEAEEDIWKGYVHEWKKIEKEISDAEKAKKKAEKEAQDKIEKAAKDAEKAAKDAEKAAKDAGD